jgi:hypothetical protein
MICGGGGEAVIYYSPEKDIEELGRIKETSSEGWLISPLDSRDGIAFAPAGRSVSGRFPALDLLLMKGVPKEGFIAEQTEGIWRRGSRKSAGFI